MRQVKQRILPVDQIMWHSCQKLRQTPETGTTITERLIYCCCFFRKSWKSHAEFMRMKEPKFDLFKYHLYTLQYNFSIYCVVIVLCFSLFDEWPNVMCFQIWCMAPFHARSLIDECVDQHTSNGSQHQIPPRVTSVILTQSDFSVNLVTLFGIMLTLLQLRLSINFWMF